MRILPLRSFPLAAASLFVGSLGAPIVLLCWARHEPLGFQFMAGADLSLIAMEFGISWGYSALVTLLLGGLFWWPLHAYAYDNVVSYISVSAICYIVMTILANGGTTWSLLAFAMILANAIGIRIVERVLRASKTT